MDPELPDEADESPDGNTDRRDDQDDGGQAVRPGNAEAETRNREEYYTDLRVAVSKEESVTAQRAAAEEQNASGKCFIGSAPILSVGAAENSCRRCRAGPPGRRHLGRLGDLRSRLVTHLPHRAGQVPLGSQPSCVSNSTKEDRSFTIISQSGQNINGVEGPIVTFGNDFSLRPVHLVRREARIPLPAEVVPRRSATRGER